MYSLAASEYIKTNKAARNLTYEDISSGAPVPLSTLHAYAKGSVANPNDEHMIRIAAFFGDGPEVIRALRAKSAESKQALSAGDTDQFAAIVRTTVAQLLDEYREQTAAQQTEIIQHANARVEEERTRASELNAKVLRQCNDEIAKAKEVCTREIEMNNKFCEQRIRMTEQHYEARLADAKDHLTQMLTSESKHSAELRERYGSSREYLKSSVRNLTGVCILLMLTNLFFGAYAIFAYTSFDMADPTRGLHRENYSMGPIMLVMSIALIAIAGSRLVILFLNRPKKTKMECDAQ